MRMNKICGVLLIVFFCSTITVGQTTFSIPDTTVTIGENVKVPVIIGVDTSDDVLSLHLNISYDTAALDFVGHVRAGSISENVTTVVNDQDGSILISMAAIEVIKESGDLIYLEFTALSVGNSELQLAEYRINENDLVNPETSGLVKVFDVSGNQPPFAVQIPDTLTFFSGDTLSIMVDESLFADAEDVFSDLDISFSINPQVVIPIFNPETNLLQVTTLDYVGFATLSVRVEDQDGGVLDFEIVLDIQMRVSNEELGSSPDEFKLDQNYPNPFNPSTNITYQIPQSGAVLLEVYSMNGQKVATLIDGVQASGLHTVRFDASGLSSGIYLYRISGVDFTATRKMLLIK